MTKPHTTLSEAVRALEYGADYADPTKQWAFDAGYQAALKAAVALVEQHEAQDPVAQCRDDGRCQYAIDHGAEGLGACPVDKCAQPTLAATQAGDAESTTAADAGGRGAAVEAIEFSLESDDGDGFLRNWFNGEFDVCRREWPEAPDAVYIGADPLFRPPTTTRSE